jgi:hypothetical protein
MAVVNSNYWPLKHIRVPRGAARGDITVHLLLAAYAPGATNDRMQLFQLPKGIQVVDAVVATPDQDSNGTPLYVFTLRLYNGTTAKPIIHQTTIGQTGGVARPSKIPATETGLGFVTPDAPRATSATSIWAVELLTDTAPATAVAGDVHIYLTLSGDYTKFDNVTE